ncbi:MAG: hypothetical protein ACUVWZ_14370 [Anaerolineae bacterium]
MARFTAYRKPFEEVLTAPNLLAIERAAEVTRTDDLRVYPIAQRDLLLDGAELPEEAEQAAMDFAALEALKYQGGKWGGKFLRAPDIFFTILEKGKGKLVRLGDIAEVRFGIKTGANEFFYLEPTGQPAPEGLVHVRNGAGWEGYLEAEFLKPVIKAQGRSRPSVSAPRTCATGSSCATIPRRNSGVMDRPRPWPTSSGVNTKLTINGLPVLAGNHGGIVQRKREILFGVRSYENGWLYFRPMNQHWLIVGFMWHFFRQWPRQH